MNDTNITNQSSHSDQINTTASTQSSTPTTTTTEQSTINYEIEYKQLLTKYQTEMRDLQFKMKCHELYRDNEGKTVKVTIDINNTDISRIYELKNNQSVATCVDTIFIRDLFSKDPDFVIGINESDFQFQKLYATFPSIDNEWYQIAGSPDSSKLQVSPTIFEIGKSVILQFATSSIFEFQTLSNENNTVISQSDLDPFNTLYDHLCSIESIQPHLLTIQNSNVFMSPIGLDEWTKVNNHNIFSTDTTQIFPSNMKQNNNTNSPISSTLLTQRVYDNFGGATTIKQKMKWEFDSSLPKPLQQQILQLSPILNNNFQTHINNKKQELNNITFEFPDFLPITTQKLSSIPVQNSLHYILTQDLLQSSLNLKNKDNDVYISSPSILNGEWIEVKGKNAIGKIEHLRIGEFINGDNQTIKVKWGNECTSTATLDSINQSSSTQSIPVTTTSESSSISTSATHSTHSPSLNIDSTSTTSTDTQTFKKVVSVLYHNTMTRTKPRSNQSICFDFDVKIYGNKCFGSTLQANSFMSLNDYMIKQMVHVSPYLNQFTNISLSSYHILNGQPIPIQGKNSSFTSNDLDFVNLGSILLPPMPDHEISSTLPPQASNTISIQRQYYTQQGRKFNNPVFDPTINIAQPIALTNRNTYAYTLPYKRSITLELDPAVETTFGTQFTELVPTFRNNHNRFLERVNSCNHLCIEWVNFPYSGKTQYSMSDLGTTTIHQLFSRSNIFNPKTTRRLGIPVGDIDQFFENLAQYTTSKNMYISSSSLLKGEWIKIRGDDVETTAIEMDVPLNHILDANKMILEIKCD